MSEQLSQNEIELLNSSLTDTENLLEEDSASAVSGIDLAALEQIHRGKLPGLEMLAERYARIFRGALSTHLGRVSSVQGTEIRTCKFSEFYKTLEMPSSMHLFRLNPLPSQGMLIFSNTLVHQLVEILFGSSGKGMGSSASLKRELSAIEQRLIAKVAILGIENFAEAWNPIKELECVYTSSESNPLAIQAISPSENVAIAEFEVELDQEKSKLLFCLPYSMLAPVRERIEKGAQGAQGAQRLQSRYSDSRIGSQLKKAQVQVSVEIAKGSVRVKDIASLKVGDVLPLSTSAEESARVYVEGVLKFRGTAGEAKGSRVVRIESAVSDSDN